MFQIAKEISDRAVFWVGVKSYAFLYAMGVQFGILARLTWWEYSWDIMEPVTYFVTYGTAMVAYSRSLITGQVSLITDHCSLSVSSNFSADSGDQFFFSLRLC